MSFQIGQRIHDYEFLSVVDTSVPTDAYEVENHAEGRREILKVLPKELQRDRQAVERFLREAKIHARLSHPSIAQFYGGMQLDDQLVMTFEAAEGVSLEDRLEGGPLSVGESVAIASKTLEALAYAHQRTVVHRDVTPQNIVVTEDGKVKLTGFQLAKQATDATLTQPGEMIGSAHYMSPEQVKGVESIDGRSDIYSLGIVLYELLTGRKPFDSMSQFDIFQAHVSSPPLPPQQIRPDIPPPLSAAIMKSLEKDPGARFPNADSFRESLHAVAKAISSNGLAGGSAAEDSESEDEAEPAPERLTAPPRRVYEQPRPSAVRTTDEAENDEPIKPARPASRWQSRDWVMVTALTVMAVAAIVGLTVFLHGG